MTKVANYNVILKPEPEGGFTATVPSLPGCVTYGKNLNDAKKMAEDAIRAYITSLEKHGEQIPTDDATFISTVNVDLSFKSAPTFA